MNAKILKNQILPLLLVVVMLGSVLLTGCQPADNTEDPTGTNGTKPPATGLEGQEYYTVTVKGQGGMVQPGVTVALVDTQGNEVARGTTNEQGSYSVWLWPAEYTAKVIEGLRDGYAMPDEKKTPENGGVVELICNTGVIIPDNYPKQPSKQYSVGDVMYDFEFMNSEGNLVRLSEVLETKKLVIINFWATWCGPCRAEFPAIQAAYEVYGDDVEVIALDKDSGETMEDVQEFQQAGGYTFNMGRDIGLYSMFNNYSEGAIPFTIFVDRYGVINEYIKGSNDDVSEWKATMERYSADNYSQDGVIDDGNDDGEPVKEKPTVSMPESSLIENAINGAGFSGSYYAPEDEYVWPWVLTENGNAIEPSNYGKHSSNAMISTVVTMGENQVFAFDYEYSIEYDKYDFVYYDLFSVYVDGYQMQKLYHKQDGKVTCYAYANASAGEHTITLVYNKDSSDSFSYMEEDNEYVHVSNLRLMSVAEMEENNGSVNVWKPAAYGTLTDEEKDTLSQEYRYYIDVVFNSNDGLYHVGTEDGPLLLAKVTGASQWSSTSLEAIGASGYLKINNIDYYPYFSSDEGFSYGWLEYYSFLGYTVVDETLSELLELVVENVGNGKNHDKEWLELCCYFEHYGVGTGVEKVTDVRRGLDQISAYKAELGVNTIVIPTAKVPVGYYYEFVPEETGVYKFYSIDEGGISSSGILDTCAYLEDKDGNVIEQGDDENGNHFVIYKKLEAGETYYLVAGMSFVDDLGQYNVVIEKLEQSDYYTMTECTANYTTTETEPYHIIVSRTYNYAIGKELYAWKDSDGYYRQVIGYDSNGDPILDMSEQGYIYVDFLNVTTFTSFIPYKGTYATLQKLIKMGYAVRGDDGNLVLKENAFDFANREDLSDEVAAALGNDQEKMEKYLAQALAHDKTDPEYGYVRATDDLIEVLNKLVSLYGMEDVDGTIVEDQWLMFCTFLKKA